MVCLLRLWLIRQQDANTVCKAAGLIPSPSSILLCAFFFFFLILALFCFVSSLCHHLPLAPFIHSLAQRKITSRVGNFLCSLSPAVPYLLNQLTLILKNSW